MAANIKKAEDLQLGGQSSAGSEKSQEEKDIDAARDLIKDSGYEDQLFPKTK